jgi:threonine dehydrogenase-like Zn-dependent dehydrogenase
MRTSRSTVRSSGARRAAIVGTMVRARIAPRCTAATHKGVTLQFGGGPHPEDWYGTLDAISEGRLDPLPPIGKIIGLNEVPDALELTRRSEGPPRIIVHPHP